MHLAKFKRHNQSTQHRIWPLWQSTNSARLTSSFRILCPATRCKENDNKILQLKQKSKTSSKNLSSVYHWMNTIQCHRCLQRHTGRSRSYLKPFITITTYKLQREKQLKCKKTPQYMPSMWLTTSCRERMLPQYVMSALLVVWVFNLVYYYKNVHLWCSTRYVITLLQQVH